VDRGFDPSGSLLAGVVVLGGSVLALREGRGGCSAAGFTVVTVYLSGWVDGAVAPESRPVPLDRSGSSSDDRRGD